MLPSHLAWVLSWKIKHALQDDEAEDDVVLQPEEDWVVSQPSGFLPDIFPKVLPRSSAGLSLAHTFWSLELRLLASPSKHNGAKCGVCLTTW